MQGRRVGLACLLILVHLMEEIQVSGGNDASDEDTLPPKPCQIFDLICGTSSGGLIAILLGRFGLSCKEAIEVYREVGATMFGGETDSGEIWRQIMEGGQLSAAMFEKKLEDLIAKYTGSKDALFRPLKNAPDTVVHDSTKTFVTVVSKIGSAGVDAYRIRSYPRPLRDINPAPYGHKWTIFEGARATCAVPLYLSPLNIQVGHATFTFQDAGYSGFNNPAKVALDEAEKTFGPDATITLVTLGTGLRSLVYGGEDGWGNNKQVDDEHIDRLALQILANVEKLGSIIQDAPQVARRVAKQLLEVANDTEISHLHMHERFKRQGQRHNYYRFNPPRGLGDIELTDYRQEATISDITYAWLKSPDGQFAITSAVETMRNRWRCKLKQAT
ncbi:acyl transferase/acyl hydrolase/lysophospholipase [Boletus edulis BED1]|uniref:Acyl transferase/acyl hydrolase/lysophospholipase n=1 Tax=Boletus edulis BED1 TaxID=1328754 RepID=A0AAD4BGK5_BOLED|nr:acyl transferase/acyl hydrolase/lysophospholipase [Boletus edulis BED1]